MKRDRFIFRFIFVKVDGRDVRWRIFHSYIKHWWLSLSEVATPVTVYRVSNFTATYLRERKIADGLAAALGNCVWMPSPAAFASVGVTKIYRHSHRPMQCSETGSAPQTAVSATWYSGHVSSSIVLEQLRWPTAQTDAGNGNETSKAVTAVPGRSSRLQGRAVALFASLAAWSVL